MISKLPRWVWLGGGVLAFSAGMINAIAVLGFAHQAVTHVTGVFSRFSVSVFQADYGAAFQTLFLILSFFGGAVLSGIILRDAHLKMGRRYGFALAVESGLLFLAAYGFSRSEIWGEYAAAMAAGLQNALASTYSGAIIRTTHLTGILTDLGVLIGHWVQGLQIDFKRVRLFAILLFFFVFGGFLGAFFYGEWKGLAMLVPAAIIGLSSIGYTIIRSRTND